MPSLLSRPARCPFQKTRKPGGGTPGFALCRKLHYVEKASPTAGNSITRFGERRTSPALAPPPRSPRFPFRENRVPFHGPQPDPGPQSLSAPACRSRLPAGSSALSPSQRTVFPYSPPCRGKTAIHSFIPIE